MGDAGCNRHIDWFQQLSLQDESVIKPERSYNGPPLIFYLENHIRKFKFMNVPVIHRPIYQRLGLHYLSLNNEKCAYYLSLASNIGFRHLYFIEISLRGKTEQWVQTNKTIRKALQNETEMHTSLEQLMPMNWTVIQFTIIDEIPISTIKSSLLNNSDGGCMGARNCAVLLATKYQKIEKDGQSKLTIETKVIHGYRRTGMQLVDQLEEVKNFSASSLKLTNRKAWWSHRFSVDTKMKDLTDQMRNDWFTDNDMKWLMDENTPLESEPKIVIADRNICPVPIESILIRDNSKPNCVTRMPSVITLIGHLCQARYRHTENPSTELVRTNLEIDPFKTFYLINPDNTLKATEEAILPLFKTKLNWEGLTGNRAAKSLDAIKVLSSKDMIIYCGHGAGYRYFMHKSIKTITSPASIFLMGCQSARFIVEGRSESFGMIMYYLTIGCPSIIGLLWDVTDKEIDKFTVTMFSNWINKENNHTVQSDTYVPIAPMPSYVYNKETVEKVQLKCLTGNAPIVIGLPTWINNNTTVPEI